jgi:O-antigen/teichoic acid export membrane protein
MTDPSGQPELSSPAPSLKQRVLRGSAWTVGGYGASQVIRLGSNLIVSRLLFPEAFGLMALVFTFLSGLEMLSDLGIGPSIIQNNRGQDPKFLNTAWVLSIARSVVLWLVACAIAYPVSQFYNQPILAYLLPVVGLTTLMQGFTSTKWMLANRNLKLEWLTILDLAIQITGVVAMVSAAFIVRSINAPQNIAIWALVIGSLMGCLMRVVLSHWVLPGPKNQFEWDSASFQELQHFGRWIFVSTLLTFFVLQGSNLIIPRLLGVGFLGVYSFASNLSQMAASITGVINSRVLYPSYAELVRERPERLRPVLKRARLVLNGVNWVISLIFIFFGKSLISIMYDARYADAGWILQILSVGALVSLLGATYGNVLLAQGKTFLMTVLMGIQVVVQLTCMAVGYWLGGEQGLIAGLSAMGWFLYPFQAVVYHRLKIWQPEVDLPLLGLATAIAIFILMPYL